MTNKELPEKRNDALAWHFKRIAGERSIETLRVQMKEAGFDIGAGTLWRLSRGDEGVRAQSIRKLAEYDGKEYDELLRMPEDAMNSEFMYVRRADVRFSNGTGQVVYEEDDKPPLVFRVDFLRKLGIKNGDAVVVDSVGISNEPKIPDGAVVLVNRGDRERLNGDLFAFRVDGELLIKRLERIDGVGILATADNPNFKPKQKVYASAIDFEVIGRAVWTGALL